MQTEINLLPLTIIEKRKIMLWRIKFNSVQMAKEFNVNSYHFREWIKGNRVSDPLQKKLEEHYLRICEEKS